jgi:prepilin-type N-terminal cleavage/methylation domain-containing protein
MRNQINKKTAFNMLEMSIVLIVIGIITALVSSGSSLITNARISSLRQATETSPVGVVKDLSFWIEASSQNSFADEDPVLDSSIALWNDINPQNPAIIKIVQGSASLQPTYKKDGDKLPYIDFDGTEEMLSNSSIKAYELIDLDQSTVFAVQKYETDATSITFDWSSGAVGSNQLRLWSDTDIYSDTGNISSGGRILVAKSTNFNNRWNIVTMVRKPNDNGVIRVNGLPLLTAPKADDFDLSGSSNLSIGSSNGANFLNGAIREIIIFRRALRQIEIDAIETYLSKKWKIDLN